ncbi:hypothetical protein V1477_014868, partial [Vespula maculifrons]
LAAVDYVKCYQKRNFDEYISQYSQYAFSASNTKELTGDTGLPKMTTKSNVRPILIVNSSVLLRISTSTHRSSRSTHSPEVITKKSNYGGGDTVPPMTPIEWILTAAVHNYITYSFNILYDLFRFKIKLWSGDTGLPKMTTKSNVRPILIVNSSVLLRISTSTHRGSPSTHSPQVIEQSLYSNCKLCFGLRRGNLENFPENIPASINEQLIKYTFEFLLLTIFSTVGILACEGGKQRRSFDRLTVTSSVVLWTSTRELRKFPGKHSCKLICEVGILACEGGKQRRSFDRLSQLLVQLCFGLRRGNLENFPENIPASINEQSIKYTFEFLLLTIFCTWGYSPAREENKDGPSTDSQLLVQLCFGLRRGNLENFPENIPASINEQLIKYTFEFLLLTIFCTVGILACEGGKQRRSFDRLTVTSSVVLWTSTRELRKFPGEHSCKLICEVGILACEGGKQRRSFDRLSQLLVQLCFGLRRGNLENFPENIPASINEQSIKYTFEFLLLTIFCTWGYSPAREENKDGPSTDSQLLVQLCFGLRRGNLENFPENIPASINEQLIKYTFEFLLLTIFCTVGILACEGGKQRRSFDRLSQLLVQLCFGLRRGNLENFPENIPASINEQSIKYTFEFLLLTIFCTWGYSPAREENKDGPSTDSQLLVQLCFGLRRGNLENFPENIPASINEQLIKYTFEFLLLTIFCTVGILACEGGKQRRSFDRLTVTSSVVLWTSTRELRKFPGKHSCKLICEVGILACEGGKQRRSFDRLSQLLVQLCFGLRRGNLENFPENIPASINEQLIKYTFEFLLLTIFCTWGYSPAREENKDGPSTDSQLLVQLCFGLRRGNLENFTENIPAMGILACEGGKQRRSFDRLSQLLIQLCFGLRRGNLENFPENIPASINEQLIKYTFEFLLLTIFCTWGYSPAREENKDGPSTDSQLLVQLCFGLRRGNLENFTENIPAMGILACEGGKQRRSFDRLSQLLVQLCFGLRRGNLENFPENIPASINEQLIKYTFEFLLLTIFCTVGILACEGGKQRRSFDRLTVTSSVVLWTSTRELRKFPGEHSCNLFDFTLICEVGILACEGGKQRRSFDRLSQLLVQLCFGLRRGNLENFPENIPASINEQLIKYTFEFLLLTIFCTWGYSPAREENKDGPSTESYIFDFALPEDFENLSPRVDLEIFANVIRASINEDLKLRFRNFVGL